MKKIIMYLGVIIGYFLLSSILVSGEQVASLDLDFIIAGLKNREVILKAVEGKFYLETNAPGAEQQIKGEELWVLSGKKERFDFKPSYFKGGKGIPTSVEDKQYNINVFDGEKTIAYQPLRKQAVIRQEKMFNPNESFQPKTLCLYWFRGRLLSANLELLGAQPKLLGLEKIADQDCCVVSFYAVPGDETTVKLWIDVKRGFTPLKLEMTNESGVRLITSLSDLGRYGEVWFPKQASYKVYSLDSRKNEQLLSEVLLSTIQLKVNEPISDEFFSITFSSKTFVSDEIGKMSYYTP